MTVVAPARSDRVAGTLVGLAAGDALGAGYEFGPPTQDPEMVGGGLGSWAPGEWTDDTQMAICVAEVAATGDLDRMAVGEGFLDWFRSGPTDVGNQPGAVLGGAKAGMDLPDLAAAHLRAHPGEPAGNGSLVRTAPVALAHLGDDEAIAGAARAVSGLTHADSLAEEACVLWCIGIDRAVREGRLDGVRDGLTVLPPGRRGFWEACLDEAESAPPEAFDDNGFVVRALQAAHAAIHHTPAPPERPCVQFAEALRTAVRVGDDTDSVAAIAGSLLGAAWGASAVPMAWRAALHGWPGYRIPDLVRLALLSAQGGRDDEVGWPSAPSLLPWYRKRWDPSGIAQALAEDPGMVVGDVGALCVLPEEIDVVVSLCRVGRQDVPPGTAAHAVRLSDDTGPENPNLEFILTDVAAQLCRWRDQGRRVFVHCVRAESRTPTVAAAYLAERLGLSGDQALARVRRVLPKAAPNHGFSTALERLWPTEGRG
ncbi:MAG TPA: ADP-ribosylglycohydrolase family protein [Acidimicrobiales bacterium]|nr:ADP-ribosylglycohydrolase family protein [Acidimicrobiales bacterium]